MIRKNQNSTLIKIIPDVCARWWIQIAQNFLSLTYRLHYTLNCTARTPVHDVSCEPVAHSRVVAAFALPPRLGFVTSGALMTCSAGGGADCFFSSHAARAFEAFQAAAGLAARCGGKREPPVVSLLGPGSLAGCCGLLLLPGPCRRTVAELSPMPIARSAITVRHRKPSSTQAEINVREGARQYLGIGAMASGRERPKLAHAHSASSSPRFAASTSAIAA